MTGFKINDEWLDFGGTVGLEIRSPLFDMGSIPGVLSYPAAFANTPRNRRLLGFPAVRARQVGPVAPVEADFYVGGSLWRRGALQFQDFDSGKGEYSYQFQADADALAGLIQDVLLSDLDLGNLVVGQQETAEYVCFPVRNNTFYDPAKNPDWGKVVNHWGRLGGLDVNNGTAHTYALAPFLKVVPLLRRCLAVWGYEVSGPWLDDEEIQQLVVYSLTALDQADSAEPATSCPIASLLPDVRVADLLLVLQQLFALAFVFNPVRKQVQVVPLRDVVADLAYQPRRPGANYRDLGNSGQGYLLAFTADSEDELLKQMPWAELSIGKAGEKIQPVADSLRMVREDDPLQPGRAWLVPAAEQPGRSARAAFEQADQRSSHLRLLFYRGMQADGGLQPYPLGSSGVVNYAGATVGKYALEWDGAAGLYAQWHKPWLDFLANARTEERTVALTLGEFLTLNPIRKDLVQGLKFLWESVSLTVGGDQTLEPATITYHQIAR